MVSVPYNDLNRLPQKRVAGAILKMHKPRGTSERVPEGENKREKVPLPGAWPQTLQKTGPGAGGLGKARVSFQRKRVCWQS